MPTAVITDSTSDLPADVAAVKGIRVVPLNVHFGEETFLDGVTIKSDEFFRRMKAVVKSGGAFPKTSQPSAGAFLEAYREAAKQAGHIISVHVSSKVSGTYNSAVQAKQEMGLTPDLIRGFQGQGPKIEVIDTLQASMTLGLVVMAVADAVRGGATPEAAADLARSLSGRARFFGLLDTLEYLHRGGRIGRARLYLGSLLSIKPILGLVEGVAHPVDRVRSRAKGLIRIAEIARREAPLSALCVLYGEDRAAADNLAAGLKDLAPRPRFASGAGPGPGPETSSGDPGVIVTQFGPVLGAYLGPEAIGVSLIKAEAKP